MVPTVGEQLVAARSAKVRQMNIITLLLPQLIALRSTRPNPLPTWYNSRSYKVKGTSQPEEAGLERVLQSEQIAARERTNIIKKMNRMRDREELKYRE